MLDNHGKLAIAEFVVYAIVLVFCVFNTFRLGFRRETGWIVLAIFCVFRIVGSIILVAAQASNSRSVGLYVAASILNSIGLSPLLSATLAFVNTCSNFSHQQNPLFAKVFRYNHLLILAAIILSSIGGSKQSDSDPSSVSQGILLSKISIILLLLSWVGISFTSLSLFGAKDSFPSGIRKLYHAVLFSLPFLLIRIIYSFLIAFNAKSTAASPVPTSKYSSTSGNWLYQLFLGVLMEFIVVVSFTVAGFFAQPESPNPQRGVENGNKEPAIGM
ncbi:hypothetical protein RUND412_007259 [Rhizina undulata]